MLKNFDLWDVDSEVTSIVWDNINLTIEFTVKQIVNTTPALVEPETVDQTGDELDKTFWQLCEPVIIGDATDESALRLLLRESQRSFVMDAVRVGESTYRATINITNFANRRQIPNGTWRIQPILGSRIGRPAKFDLSKVDNLADHSRNFLYNRNYSVYVVSFGLSNNEEAPDFLIRTYQFTRPSAPKKRKRRISLKRRILQKKRRIAMLRALFDLAEKTKPAKKPVLLFASEARTSLGGNLLAIHDRMLERNLDKDFDFKFSFSLPKDRSLLERVKQVLYLGRSDIVVIDDYYPTLQTIRMPQHKKVIQAWHAGSGFKAVGYTRFGNYGSPKLSNPHRYYTYAICGSQSLRHVYAENFGIEERAVIPTGLPRIDKFLTESTEAKQRFLDQFPIVEGKRLVLFAPTFRGNGLETAHYDYSQIDFDELYEFCGNDTIIGFRMHHFIKEVVPLKDEHRDRFIDLTHYQDGLGLLHSVDVLITDYSSIIYEYSLLDKPMLFFAYDRDVYAATRGFHRDYDETAPGKVCLSFTELLSALKNEDYDPVKREQFRIENFDNIDSKSTDRFIDWLILGDLPEEYLR